MAGIVSGTAQNRGRWDAAWAVWKGAWFLSPIAGYHVPWSESDDPRRLEASRVRRRRRLEGPGVVESEPG